MLNVNPPSGAPPAFSSCVYHVACLLTRVGKTDPLCHPYYEQDGVEEEKEEETDENSIPTALNVRIGLSLVTSSVVLQTTKPILCLFILDKLLHLRERVFF